jgi:hypothetical protein
VTGAALRVVQWATGGVGSRAVPAVVDHPDLELVGALVYSADKAGRDVGVLCGIGSIGVITTMEPADILALEADCVLYMAQGEMNPNRAVDDICALLASRKNVVSTALTALINPAGMGQDVVDRLEDACAAGRSSFHGTGIEPGWASEVLPLTMSGLLRYVDSLLVQELFDYSTYESAEMLFGVMGFGRPPEETAGVNAALLGSVFRGPLMLVAQGLGATIDDFTYSRDVWVTDEPFDVVAGRIEAGTVAAQQFSVTAVVDSRPALTVEHVTRMGERAAPEWPRGQGWRVTVVGSPSMVLEAHIATDGEDGNDQGLLGTAMHAVHAVVPVCAADPGIKTFLDLPPILGRHVLRRRRHTSS